MVASKKYHVLLPGDAVLCLLENMCPLDAKMFILSSKRYLKMFNEHVGLKGWLEKRKFEYEGWMKIIENVITGVTTHKSVDRSEWVHQFFERMKPQFVFEQLLTHSECNVFEEGSYLQKLRKTFNNPRDTTLLFMAKSRESSAYLLPDKGSVVQKYAKWQCSRTFRRAWRIRFEYNLSDEEKMWKKAVDVYNRFEPSPFIAIGDIVSTREKHDWRYKTPEALYKEMLNMIHSDNKAEEDFVLCSVLLDLNLRTRTWVVLLDKQFAKCRASIVKAPEEKRNVMLISVLHRHREMCPHYFNIDEERALGLVKPNDYSRDRSPTRADRCEHELSTDTEDEEDSDDSENDGTASPTRPGHGTY